MDDLICLWLTSDRQKERLLGQIIFIERKVEWCLVHRGRLECNQISEREIGVYPVYIRYARVLRLD